MTEVGGLDSVRGSAVEEVVVRRGAVLRDLFEERGVGA